MLCEWTNPADVDALLPCLEALSAHHNAVSTYFHGAFPSRPYAYTLESFRDALQKGQSRIAVIVIENTVAGFAKVDIDQAADHGKLDYLIVLDAYRGMGYGKALMDWAMDIFADAEISTIEIKVIEGNDAAQFYERYGFRPISRMYRRKV